MTPVVLFLLFLSFTAIHPGATQDEVGDDSLDVSEVIARANENATTTLEHGDVKRSKQRNAAFCTYRGCKWPKQRSRVYIPVSFSHSYNKAQLRTIIGGLVSFYSSTCIRFVYRTRQHRHYIHIFPGTGCWSYIGRQSNGQSISLSAPGCLTTGTVQHEVLHALGLHHEQARIDRDRHVKILYQNIRPGKQGNFRKVWTNNLATPYDFSSVMHYSKYAFSKNGRPTIISRRNPSMTFGGATRMSRNDIIRVNRLYRCY